MGTVRLCVLGVRYLLFSHSPSVLVLSRVLFVDTFHSSLGIRIGMGTLSDIWAAFGSTDKATRFKYHVGTESLPSLTGFGCRNSFKLVGRRFGKYWVTEEIAASGVYRALAASQEFTMSTGARQPSIFSVGSLLCDPANGPRGWLDRIARRGH